MKLALGVSALVMLATLCAAGVSQDTKTNGKAAQKQAAAPEGEKLFETHCLRCHQPPENLSPNAAKAVLRHMRVRASLSEKDEQAILQYISPR